MKIKIYIKYTCVHQTKIKNKKKQKRKQEVETLFPTIWHTFGAAFGTAFGAEASGWGATRVPRDYSCIFLKGRNPRRRHYGEREVALQHTKRQRGGRGKRQSRFVVPRSGAANPTCIESYLKKEFEKKTDNIAELKVEKSK